MKRFQHFIYTLAVLSLVSLSACQSIDPVAPTVVPSTATIEPVLSSLQLPLAFPLSGFSRLINEKLDDPIHQDIEFGKKKQHELALTVSKIADVRLSMSGNKLNYVLPLRVDVGAKTKIGIKSSTSFALNLYLESLIDVDRQWKVLTKTSLKRLEWIDQPEVKIAFIKVNITKQVEKALYENIAPLLKKVDATIHEELPLKAEITKIWTSLQRAIQVNKKVEPFWLQAKPKEIILASIRGNQRELHINIMLKTFLSIMPSKDRPTQKVIPLPPLQKTRQAIQNDFDLNVLVRLPFDELNRLLNERVKNQKIELEDYTIKIKKIELQGSKDTLLLTTKIKGDAKGELYFKGVPAYDSLSAELWIDQFDFDVNTEDMLVGSVDWLLHDNFTARVQNELRLPIAEHVAHLPRLIEQGIANSKIGNKISLSLPKFKLVPQQLLVNNKEVQALIKVRGELELDLNKVIQ